MTGGSTRKRRIAILVPILDDWDSFMRLAAELAIGSSAEAILDIVAIDDGSRHPFDLAGMILPAAGAVREVRIIHLALNLGHQRAIAIGLVETSARQDVDAVVVMDGDGEDRPEDLQRLLSAADRLPDHVIFAERVKRSESALFKAGHVTYRQMFRLLTGKSINFGNFSLMPFGAVKRLVHMPDLWNNLPAAVMRSRLPYGTAPTVRGRRYAGSSKMNWVGLVVHGLSALSVYSDVIFVRMLIAAGVVAALALAAIVAAIAIRVTTNLAIPGWTTTIVGVFLIVLVQMVVAVIVTSLLVLAGRSNRPFVPIKDGPLFVAERQSKIFRADIRDEL
jgi:polyisoprenyl-phosphate glycosyltransferase